MRLKPLLSLTALTLLFSLVTNTFPTFRVPFAVSDPHIAKPLRQSTFTYATVVASTLATIALYTGLSRHSKERKCFMLLYFLQAHSITFIVTNCIKSSVGRLRPDFLARCAPVGNLCTGNDDLVNDGRRSLPSGHTSTTACTASFLACNCSDGSGRRVARCGLAGLALAFCVVVGLSRVYDNKHFASDTAMGFLIGVGCGGLSEKVYTIKTRV